MPTWMSRIADQAKGEVIRLGALEGGLTDGEPLIFYAGKFDRLPG